MAARKLIGWLWIPVAMALVWSGWVLYSRRAENQRIEREAARKEAEADAKILLRLGGSDLKILMFYASPAVVKRGERGLLCYGVSNAVEVRIEPPVDGVGPSISRCVEIRPERDTEYTLKARDAGGQEVSQAVTVRSGPE